VWDVVVAYEDGLTREEAAKFCDLLEARCHARREVHITWWSFASIETPAEAEKAAMQAAGADVVVFAVRPEGELPRIIQDWLESWLTRRRGREGTLVGLLDRHAESLAPPAPRYVYLRNAAHRGALDYVTELPESVLESIPESIEFYSERAAQTSPVLDEILHQAELKRRFPSRA
jgi:hypothetical protein